MQLAIFSWCVCVCVYRGETEQNACAVRQKKCVVSCQCKLAVRKILSLCPKAGVGLPAGWWEMEYWQRRQDGLLSVMWKQHRECTQSSSHSIPEQRPGLSKDKGRAKFSVESSFRRLPDAHCQFQVFACDAKLQPPETLALLKTGMLWMFHLLLYKTHPDKLNHASFGICCRAVFYVVMLYENYMMCW